MIINDSDPLDNRKHVHHFGRCLVENDKDDALKFIFIPKNASSFTRNLLINNNFKLSNYQKSKNFDSPTIVTLRDPYDRWITGALEYLVRKFPDPVPFFDDETWLYDNIEVDPHTARQTKFLHNLNTDNITFFYLDKDYNKNLHHFLEQNLDNIIWTQNLWRNSSDESSIKKKIRPMLVEKIKQGCYQRLMTYLAPDYELINSINFYRANGA